MKLTTWDDVSEGAEIVALDTAELSEVAGGPPGRHTMGQNRGRYARNRRRFGPPSRRQSARDISRLNSR